MDISIDEEPPDTNVNASNVVTTASNVEVTPSSSSSNAVILQVNRVEVGTNTSPKSDKTPSSDEDLEHDITCSICLEEWDNSSEHRVVSLKCGHLFGRSCVERWLKGHQQCCPQCKTKSRRSDLRNVYARAVKMKDTSERDRALKDLERERSTRLKLEIEIQTLNSQLLLAHEQLQRERELKMRPSIAAISAPNSASQMENYTALQLELTKTIKIKDGQCRVLAASDNLTFMAISQFSPNKLFPGYGIRKIDNNTLDQREYISLHKDSIRDMCFHPGRQNGLLLTASMDKSLKLTSVACNSVVHTFPTEKAVWACTWNHDEDNHLFAGLNDGSVLLFDMRNTNTHLLSLPSTGSAAPVASLQYVPTSVSGTFHSGGLLIGQLNRCTFMESTTGGRPWNPERPHVLPIHGPITSISFEQHFRHMLVTCRPNSQHPTMTHTVYELVTSNDRCACNVVHRFAGGELETILVKSLLIRNPLNKFGMLACAGDERKLSTLIWDVQTGKQLQTLGCDRPVVAIGSFNTQNCDRLVTLADSTLSIYNFS